MESSSPCCKRRNRYPASTFPSVENGGDWIPLPSQTSGLSRLESIGSYVRSDIPTSYRAGRVVFLRFPSEFSRVLIMKGSKHVAS